MRLIILNIILVPACGEATNKDLKRLQTELHANNSSIEMDLGGENHCCLALVLADTKYATIPNTEPFVAPECLALLAIPTIATPIEALKLKETYNK